jgi:hypothetical protein
MESLSYFPGQKLNLKTGKWEVLSVDNIRKMVTCQKLNTLDTIIETFAMERIPNLKTKKEAGFLGSFIFGTFFWTCFLFIALEVYK